MLTSPGEAGIVGRLMEKSRRLGRIPAAAGVLAMCMACGAPEFTDGAADESPARAPIDLGSKRETSLAEAFYPAPLANESTSAKPEN